jgi:hypothetical protein
MPIVCVSCEREVETTSNHRCEAETSVLLPEAPPPPPAGPPAGSEDELIHRLGTLSPVVKAWFARADAAARAEAVKIMTECIARASRRPATIGHVQDSA